MGRRWIWYVMVLVFLLQFFLHGCGRAPDPETLALAEASDAVCLAEVKAVKRVSAPEGEAYLMTCRVKEDYLGSLTRAGYEGAKFFWRPEVLLTEEEYRRYMAEYRERTANGNTELTLFLKLSAEGSTFIPAGEKALRWGGPKDAQGLRLREALWNYGREHPRDWLGLH